jgi:hypothetical protein
MKWREVQPRPAKPVFRVQNGADSIEIQPYEHAGDSFMVCGVLSGIVLVVSVPAPIEAAQAAAVPALRLKLNEALAALERLEGATP